MRLLFFYRFVQVRCTFAYFNIMAINITYPYKTHFIELPGNCKIAYIDEGKGDKTLLFIHGLANYAPVWKKNIDQLKKNYRCIAIDLPGNGLSDQNTHKYSMTFFAECIFNFIEALKLRNLCLMCHSMGGQIAIITLLKYPDCAGSLALCAPAGFEQFSIMEKTMFYNSMHLMDFFTSDEHNLRSTVENSFYHYRNQADNMVNELVEIMKTYKINYYRKMVEACIKSMLEEPVFDKLHLIKQPALVMFGKNDALIPNKLIHHTTTEKIAAEGVKKMPHGKLEMIPDCGHFVQWEKADAVNNCIAAFLQ